MSKDKTSEPLIIKGPKGEFDLSSPEGKSQLEEVLKKNAETQGRLAQKLDELERNSQAPVKKYELGGVDLNLEEAKQKAKELRDNGADESAIDSFWAEFSSRSVRSAQSGNEFEVLWADYKSARRDEFSKIGKFDEEVYKDFVKRNYLKRLDQEPNQFQFLDQLFEDKLRAVASVSQELEKEDPPVVGGSSQGSRDLKAGASKDSGSEDSYSMSDKFSDQEIEYYKKLGFKIR